MLLLAAADAGEGQAFSPFDVNTGVIFWTWVVFGILLFVLWKWVWPVILRAVEERERRITQQLAEADKANQEAQALLEEHKKLVAGARQDASRLVAEAKSVAEKEREQLLAKARAEQEDIVERARREIQSERDRALADLRLEAVDLALAAASRLIEKRLDDEGDRKLVTEYLASLEEQH